MFGNDNGASNLNQKQSMIRLIITGGLLSATLINAGCAAAPSFDSRLGSIIKPYTFSIVQWELRTIPREIKERISGKHGKINIEDEIVTRYFSIVGQISTLKSALKAVNSGNRQGDAASLEAELDRLQQQRTELADAVVRTIGRQIKQTLAEQGIFNPLTNVKVNFPPLNFTLEKPPHLLVVSPRDRIESVREITLRQNINLEEMEGIEAKVDQLDVSSLVVELGGYGGTYPSFVSNNGSLKFTIETAIEEWLHQYLVFKPLCFLYILDLTGVSRNYEIATVNETINGKMRKENGTMGYCKN